METPAQHPCAICGLPMQIERRFGFDIDFCPEHGIWLDKGELKAIIEVVKARRAEGSTGRGRSAREVGEAFKALRESLKRAGKINRAHEGDRPCPVCSLTMVVAPWSGVYIDACPEHGLWLDKGELAAIIANQPDRRLWHSPPPPSIGGGGVLADVLGSSIGDLTSELIFTVFDW